MSLVGSAKDMRLEDSIRDHAPTRMGDITAVTASSAGKDAEEMGPPYGVAGDMQLPATL